MCRTKNGALRNSSIDWILLQSRTTQSRILLRKDKIRPNTQPEIPWDLSLWRRWSWRNLSKVLDTSSATAQVPPSLLKALAIILVATLRKSAVDQEVLNLYLTWKQKRGHISRMINKPIISFSKILLTI